MPSRETNRFSTKSFGIVHLLIDVGRLVLLAQWLTSILTWMAKLFFKHQTVFCVYTCGIKHAIEHNDIPSKEFNYCTVIIVQLLYYFRTIYKYLVSLFQLLSQHAMASMWTAITRFSFLLISSLRCMRVNTNLLSCFKMTRNTKYRYCFTVIQLIRHTNTAGL